MERHARAFHDAESLSPGSRRRGNDEQDDDHNPAAQHYSRECTINRF
jgi:hypothetical protein